MQRIPAQVPIPMAIPKVDQLTQWELKSVTTTIAGNQVLVNTSQTSLQSKVIQKLVALEAETDQILLLENSARDQALTIRITETQTLLGIQSAMASAKQRKTKGTQAQDSTTFHTMWPTFPVIKCQTRMTNGDSSESSQNDVVWFAYLFNKQKR